jgi:GNAT superfamily N-acetyltransferase
MLTIRQGGMRDCKDLLEVYMNTHWTEKYTTVEQVKAAHRGIDFQKWGWLVVEVKGRVVGEVLFRIEKNPVVGRIGIITDIGVDVRYQKKGIGTKLVAAAESALKDKKANRLIATSPPDVYNFWMKMNWFARGSLMDIEASPSKIPIKKTTEVSTMRLEDVIKLPKSMLFSNIAYPGLLAEMASAVVGGRRRGELFEFYSKDALVGVGVCADYGNSSAKFVADITMSGAQYFDVVVSRTARVAIQLKARTVTSRIPSDKIQSYGSLTRWSSQLARNIPITKLV